MIMDNLGAKALAPFSKREHHSSTNSSESITVTIVTYVVQTAEDEYRQSLVLHTFVVAGSCRQPQKYVKPKAAITVFELLMMSGVSLETC